MEFEGNFCPNCGTPADTSITEEQQPVNEVNEDNGSSSDDRSPESPNSSPSPNNQQDYSYVKLPNYQMPQQKEKWYQKSWVVILFLVFIWPVGLFLMWKYKKNWTKVAKIIITVLIALCVLYSCSTMGDADTTSETTTLSEGTTDETTDITEEKKSWKAFPHPIRDHPKRVQYWTAIIRELLSQRLMMMAAQRQLQILLSQTRSLWQLNKPVLLQ